VHGKIDARFSDQGEQLLKNIVRPVRVYRVELGALGVLPPAPTAASPSGPPRLSIVVLPFANRGDDLAQEHLVDGVLESLTTDLSRIPGAFVIARNTAFTYKGKSVDVRQLGRELGIRYVLAGSVQRGGTRLRVNVELLDAESGGHLWAERFDRDGGELFEIQDEIVARLARTLDVELTPAEARRAERVQRGDFDALALTFGGWAAFNRGLTPESLTEADHCFEQALTLDPRSAQALVGRALATSRRKIAFFGPAVIHDRDRQTPPA
jgi:TolB-like protein